MGVVMKKFSLIVKVPLLKQCFPFYGAKFHVNRFFMEPIRTPFWLVKSFKNPRIFEAAFSCAPMRQASLFAWQRLSQHHGLPSGSFGADDTWLT
jgi:hypothetical protein